MNIEKEKVEMMKKSSWKRRIKEKVNKKIDERLHIEMEGKAKSRTIKEGKWKWKNLAIRSYDGWDRKDIANKDKTANVGSENWLYTERI